MECVTDIWIHLDCAGADQLEAVWNRREDGIQADINRRGSPRQIDDQAMSARSGHLARQNGGWDLPETDATHQLAKSRQFAGDHHACPLGRKIARRRAGAAGREYKVGKVPFQAIAKAVIGGEYEGFAKVIADKATDDTIGVHIVGPHATDLIAEASLGISLEVTPWEIGAATHPHPTLSEVLGEAAMAVDGRSINF